MWEEGWKFCTEKKNGKMEGNEKGGKSGKESRVTESSWPVESSSSHARANLV